MNTQSARTGWIPWVISAIGVASVIAFVVLYPPANELAREAGRIILSLIFTPFILEAFFIVVGILIVIILNNRRLAKEAGDEWVYLHQIEPDTLDSNAGESIPDSLRHRIEDAPFVGKPTPVGDAERIAEIGGYLDLGMAGEAAEALMEIPEEALGEPDYLLLRIRLASLRGNRDEVENLCSVARSAGVSESDLESAGSAKGR